MKKATFWILLCIEFMCCWIATDMYVGRGWLNALLMIGGNIVFAKWGYQKFMEWFELPEAEPHAVENAVLAITAAEAVLFLVNGILLVNAI